MTQVRGIIASAAISLLGFAFTFSNLAIAEEDHPAERMRLRKLSDQKLHDRLTELLSQDDFRRQFAYEACLSEIVSRGKKQGTELLQVQFDALMARRIKVFDDETEPGSIYNLELLTALRRTQMQPDPLTILIEHGKGPLRATPSSLPHLKVSIKNTDIERKEVGLTFGGDYRSGRQARWRLAVVDDKGKSVPRKSNSGLLIGGGVYTEEVLKHGDSWETVITMRDFISPPLPGRYTLQVLYHNTRTILFSADVSGLILCRSVKIPFVVSPTVIELTAKQKQSARAWILALKPADPVKIVSGTYGKWAHDFVRPESPHGKLLSMGLTAAPALIEILQDETLSFAKRASVFSVLYSVTGTNDPRLFGAVANYECINGPWQVIGGRPGESGSGGVGFTSQSRGYSSAGKSGDEHQKILTKKWTEWLQTANVKVTGK